MKREPTPASHVFEFVYLDSSGFTAYELADDELEWLMSEDRPPAFWLQRRPVFGKFGGYVRRDQLSKDIEIRVRRSYHEDRSHLLPFD